MGERLEREASRAKTSSTFTNNAPTPSARAPIQSSGPPRAQGGSDDARPAPAQPRRRRTPRGRPPPASAKPWPPAREAATASRDGFPSGLPLHPAVGPWHG